MLKNRCRCTRISSPPSSFPYFPPSSFPSFPPSVPGDPPATLVVVAAAAVVVVGAGLLQMIIHMDRPLANDHLNWPAS